MKILRLFLLGLLLPAPALGEELAFTPGSGETVRDLRPVISIQLPPGTLYSSARLWVNGREVSLMCLRTSTFVSYQPAGEMTPGPVQVRFWAPTREGRYLEASWSFEIRPINAITSVTHDARENLGEYDEVTVEMVGQPGGEAWFQIEGLGDRVPMPEVEEGVYRGTYTVKPGDYKLAARVVAYLRLGRRISEMAAEKPVTLFGNIFKVRILSPRNNSTVPLSFDIKGRTRPGSRLSIVPKIGFQEGMAPPTRSDTSGTVGAIEALADEQGYFTVHYGIPLKLPNMHLILTVTAVDPRGERSAPTHLYLKF
jgi:hypothetical protein